MDVETHRALIERRLHAAGIVVTYTAGGLALPRPRRLDVGADARVGPYARRVLGSQMDQIRLGSARRRTHRTEQKKPACSSAHLPAVVGLHFTHVFVVIECLCLRGDDVIWRRLFFFHQGDRGEEDSVSECCRGISSRPLTCPSKKKRKKRKKNEKKRAEIEVVVGATSKVCVWQHDEYALTES